MVFASEGARNTAITAPEAGMTAYINSGDSSEGLYSYTGTTWNKGPGWNAPWGILTSAFTQTSTLINANHTAETVTVTSTAVTIVANRTIKITAGCKTAAGALIGASSARIRRGTTTAGTLILLSSVPAPPGTFVETGFQVVGIDTGASGSTQYVLTLSHSANVEEKNPTSIIVEDIGPSGAPN